MLVFFSKKGLIITSRLLYPTKNFRFSDASAPWVITAAITAAEAPFEADKCPKKEV